MAVNARTFRIFVSSTFSDLVAERDALQARVFPRLRDLCLQNNARFQAIDLRWGVSEEAGLDQRTMAICLEEIDRCREISPPPNFIVLLGDRYGWRPLPREIPVDEFDAIVARTSDDDDLQLLERWYPRDDNALYRRKASDDALAVHALRPRTLQLPDGPNDARQAVQANERKAWGETEPHLRRILLGAIDRGALHDVHSDEAARQGARLKYEASATEQEIVRGALDVEDATDHVFCFFRTIPDLNIGHPAARAFTDVLGDGTPDAAATARLASLKASLERKVGKDNVFPSTVAWADVLASQSPHLPKGEDAGPFGGLSDHLRDLCRTVHDGLRTVIEQELAKLRKQEEDPLGLERAAHRAFANDRAHPRTFVGRRSILDLINEYVDEARRAERRPPLAVVGPSGAGKSALIARAAQEAEGLSGHRVVARFIGWTPGSATGRDLLSSVIHDVAELYGDPAPIPTEYRELSEQLPARLARASHNRPLVVFLDALDQLARNDPARSLSWIPTQLPPHVSLVVSSRPEDEFVVPLRHRVPEGHVMELGPLTKADGATLLERWLDPREPARPSGRTLQDDQRKEVLKTLPRTEADAGEGLPLYLKLAVEEARSWTSHQRIGREIEALPSGVPGIVGRMFGRLSDDANHGALVVERSLAYLSASRYGLSEDEVVDLLSRDSDVLADFRRRQPDSPAVSRLPVVVWSRLFFDLEPYLSERDVEGARLLAFYHRQLLEGATDTLLGAERSEKRKARHSALASYFDEQPLDLGTPSADGEGAANLRKLTELPYQQTLAEMWAPLFTTLTDFGFLERKASQIGVQQYRETTSYTGISQIRDDLDLALQRLSLDGEGQEPEPRRQSAETFAILLDAISSSAHLLEREPAALAPQIHNLVFNDHGEQGAAGAIVSPARTHLETRAWLRLRSRSGSQIRRALLRVLHQGSPVRGVDWAHPADHLVTGNPDGVVKVWEARTGALSAVHQLEVGELFDLTLSPDGACLAIGTHRGLVLLRHPAETPSHIEVVPGASPVVAPAFSPSRDLLAWAEPGSVKVVRVLDGSAGPSMAIANDPILQSPLSLRWSPGGESLVAGSRYGWRLWRTGDWSTGPDEIGLRRSPVTALAWSPSGDRLAIGLAVPREGRNQAGRRHGRIDLVASNGRPILSIDPRSGPITALEWSPDGRELATAITNERTLGIYGIGVGIGADELVSSIQDDTAPIPLENLVTLWNADTGILRGLLRGHHQPVASLRWSKDGERLLSGSEDGTARVWLTGLAEPIDERVLRQGHADRVTCAAICPSGSTFATASADTTVRLWDLENDTTPVVVEKGDFGIGALAWAPNSHYDLAVTGIGKRIGTLARFDEGFFRRSLRLRDLTTGRLARMPGSSFRGRSIAWSPGGDLIAAGGDRVAVWEPGTQRRRLDHKAPAGVSALGWSTGGRWLAWTEGGGSLRIYDREVDAITRHLLLEGPAATSLAWLDDRLCAVGHEDGSVELWDATAERRCWRSRPASAAVTCLASFHAPKLIAAGLSDTSVRLFRVASGRPVSVVFLPSPGLAFRVRDAELDVVDDGTSQGTRPGTHRFELMAPSGPRRSSARPTALAGHGRAT